MGRRILITGLAGAIASALAARLEDREDVEYIGGIDVTEPSVALRRTELLRGELRSPTVAQAVTSTRADTLVHLGLEVTPGRMGGRARMKEHNVMGALQLLGAAGKAPLLRQVVVRSTTAVYGSDSPQPTLLPEETPVGAPAAGYAKDAAEVEGYARALGRRREDVTVTILRLASTVGPAVDTPLTRYFTLPAVPTLLGYDARLQLLHEQDAAAVFEQAVHEGHAGVFNVGGSGVLYLSQAIRLAGKPTIPVAKPLLPWVADALRATGRGDFSPDELGFLVYGRVADLSRLRDRFGYTPRYSTREAFADFLATRGIEPLVGPATVERAERWLRQVLVGSDPGRAERARQGAR